MPTPFTVNHFWTTNIELAACMFALGFKLRQNNPITRVIDAGRQSDTFWFNPECEDSDFGPIKAKLVLDIWKQNAEAIEQSTNGLAEVIDYMRTAADNRRLMLSAIKQHVDPLVIHHVDGREVMLPLSASPELQAKMKEMIANT